MANPNKRKGDVAERAVRDYADDRYVGSFKTRAGFNDDLGDVIVEHPAGRVVLQVKDVASPKWRDWYRQLTEQVGVCTRESNRPTVGGLIVHKYRGHANPAEWHAVAPLSSLLDLLDDVYDAGHRAGYDNRAADEYAGGQA